MQPPAPEDDVDPRQADFDTARRILTEAGIAVLGRSARTEDDAVAAAREAGFPVAMKLVSPDVVHKSDVGAVVLDVADADDARRAWRQVMGVAERVGAKRVDGVLVQPMVRPGFEVLVGARQDPVFGPVTMVGTGGRVVELYRDVAPGVGVLDEATVRAMLRRTRAGRVVAGYRGPALDEAALVDIAVRLSRLMEARPDIVEVDLNPVILYERGAALVDARIILGEPVRHPRAEDISAERLASLDAIFNPRSAAVVGASRPGTIGGIILKNSERVERLYPINPRRERLLGRRCYPGIDALPETPDVGVFAVPAEPTVAAFERFCARGGKGAIIVSDGFSEMGRPDLEEALVRTAREHGVVYIGPNCLGVYDAFSGLNTLFLPRRRSRLPRRAGPIGIISQSGGIGLELLEMAAADDLPIGRLVSVGNASGVSIPELLAHMGADDRIGIVAIYLEGLRNGLQFMEVARDVAAKKPVIVIKGGMAGGAAATQSHTGSLAGSFAAFKAACQQAGVVLLEHLTEDPKFLTNVLSILVTQKPARGRKVAVVSVGGGAAILLADQLTSHGFELTCFADATRDRLARLLGGKANGRDPHELARNPLDLFGDADDDRLVESLRILDADPNTDVIVVGIYFQVPYLSEYAAERLAELQAEMSKPLVLSLRGFSPYVFQTREWMIGAGVPSYTVPLVEPLRVAVDIWERYGADFSARAR